VPGAGISARPTSLFCQLVLGLVGIFLTMFCFIGALILVPLTVWTVVEAFMMFADAITDSDGQKLR
jgi:uncharacterized membrane protein